ncbi:hypothetical protein A1O3_09642 [Capronia epimyces CBS 606.96]|uniref:G-patch domain-containing protein n=1 Tax=Capronia epimyces CBS 606.96 TaxID=1182542 RepID=W9XKE3_9EURO|nr:uncharacterized protein A1O3_09642 [Capronia epimyces CBS 606.96]EXJ77416.1 hypothetical protein A1O3_09642 [Capronia epimyces CBS 606.96]
MASKRSRQAFEADLQNKTSPFVAYGTPLPPTDEQSRDDGSFVPIWKQEATDEQGRKRLHGAFTGGFSAGYFNTVGSKEGWTPSSFVSSRQNRLKDAQKPTQRPEDFMDEEDLREAEESRALNISNEFAGFGTEHDPVRKTATIGLFRPLDETIGSKLLKRMGWREGQGIGPRVRRVANLGDDEDEPGEKHLFAPEDVRVVSYERKTDYKGLGYEKVLSNAREPTTKPLVGQEDSSTRGESPDEDAFGPRLGSSRKHVQRSKKSGIGVGVLNDDGSDDEDPYSMGPKISYHRVIGGDKKSKTKPKNPVSSPNPLLKTKPTFISKKLAELKGALRRCHDGRLPLEGFVLADQLGIMTIQDDKYRPPEVPVGWKSSVLKETITNSGPPTVSSAEAARASTLTAKSRASILGESQLPGKSVFDFLTPAARDKLAAASGRQDLPTAGSEARPKGFESPKSTPLTAQSLVPHLAPDVALQALHRGTNGWMPYAEDEKKRNRYRIYLEIQAGLRKTAERDELPARAEGMTQDDWVIEMHEFARAAEVFKPISGLMASRFTSSSSLPEGQNGDLSNDTKESLFVRSNAKPEDPAESAAKMGMFGPMTRSVSSFSPTRLLCKRFNVPLPDHTASAVPSARTDMAFSGKEHTPGATQQSRSFMSVGGQTVPSDVDNVQRAERNVQSSKTETGELGLEVPMGPAVIQPDRNEALEQERPGQAVFKAIFGSDDEDD